MNKINCEDLKLIVTLPDGSNIDLTPFFLTYPIYVTVKNGKTFVIYFSKERVFKFEIDEPFPDKCSAFIETDDTCLEDLDTNKLMDIISEAKGVYESALLIDKFILHIKIRLGLIDLYRDKLLKAMKKNNLDKVEELMGNLLTIVRTNAYELTALKEIAEDKVKQLLDTNNKHKELIKEIVSKINGRLGLNIDIEENK